MTFLNGFLATFAVLGAIPVIIHLLNRRRFKVITWAAMEFLLATIKKNYRRLQLRDIILMLLRTAALILLALALARPTIAPGGLGSLGSKGRTTAVIVLDNSLSMGYKAGQKTLLQVAKERTDKYLEGLPAGAAAALILLSNIAIVEIPEPSRDIGFVRSVVQLAPLFDAGTRVVESLGKALEILENDKTATAREIYLVTDMQANAWPAEDSSRWKALVAKIKNSEPKISLFLVDVGEGRRDNVSIDALEVRDVFVSKDSTVTFDVRLHNHDGAAPVKNVDVKLLVGQGADGKMESKGSRELPELESEATVRLSTQLLEGGDYRIQVKVEGVDHLDADNSRYLVVQVLDNVKVLLIDGNPADEDLGFGGETDFLEAALSPEDFEADEGGSVIRTKVTTITGLGNEDLEEYSAVVLANVDAVSATIAKKLERFVKEQGGGLIIFPGDNIRADNAERYNKELAGLLPARFVTSDLYIEPPDTDDAKDGFGLATDDLSHPIVSFYADRDLQHFLAEPRFLKALRVKPLPEGNGAGKNGADGKSGRILVVARYAGGEPAIVERKFDRGSVLLFTSAANKQWSDFPLRGSAFVPIVRRAMQHVTLGRRPNRNVIVHDPLFELLRLDEIKEQATVLLPDKTTKTVSPMTVGGLEQLKFNDTHFAGFYRLVSDVKDTDDEGNAVDIASWYAANPPRDESNLEKLDEDDIEKRYPDLKFEWIGVKEDVDAAVRAGRVGREIWPFLFALAVLCLLTESILASLWAPREA